MDQTPPTDQSDRRAHERFEVVGQLWGYLTFSEAIEVRDVSDGGVLAVARGAPPPGSVQSVEATAGPERRVETLQMRVRHVRDAAPASGHARHFVGFECVDPDGAFWRETVRTLRQDAGSGGSQP